VFVDSLGRHDDPGRPAARSVLVSALSVCASVHTLRAAKPAPADLLACSTVVRSRRLNLPGRVSDYR